MDWTTRIQSLTQAKDFSSLCIQTGFVAHPASYLMGMEGVTMSRSYASSTPKFLHGMQWDSFTLQVSIRK
jgi:hypothetical protein